MRSDRPAASSALRSCPTGRSGFTLLESLIALLLLTTAVTILVQSQTIAVRTQEESRRLSTATMLARQIMTDLEIRMEFEGFGEMDVKEHGDFRDHEYGDEFEDYWWEYEVEKVDLELPPMSTLMGLAGDSADDAAGGMGVETGGLQPGNELAALSGLGLDFTMFSEMLANYMREARARVCWNEQGGHRGSTEGVECVELITHLANPTGKVLSVEEQEALHTEEDTR